MADKPTQVTVIDDWQGMVSNASPHKLKPGMARWQENLRSQTVGQADVRPGVRPVTFSNAITAVTDEIIAMYAFTARTDQWVLYEDSSGKIHAGKNPSIS